MGQIVGAFAVSHTAMMIRKYDPSRESHVRVLDGFSQVREAVRRLVPDCAIIVGSEHLRSFTYDCLPQICIGTGETSEGWGDAGVAPCTTPLSEPLARDIIYQGVAEGFDLAWAVEPKLDHGFMAPWQLIRPEMDIPLVPVFQNASTEPISPFSRAAKLGELLRKVVDARPDDERILLVGTGGLSHWVGTPEMGKINEAFDSAFLRYVEDGDVGAMAELTTSEVSQEAGNGAQEIRNWITCAAAMRPYTASVLVHESIEAWGTGMAIAQLTGA